MCLGVKSLVEAKYFILVFVKINSYTIIADTEVYIFFQLFGMNGDVWIPVRMTVLHTIAEQVIEDALDGGSTTRIKLIPFYYITEHFRTYLKTSAEVEKQEFLFRSSLPDKSRRQGVETRVMS